METSMQRCPQVACRFSSDQTFTEIEATRLETMSVIDGTWYIYLKGDYAGRVSGNVYDIRNQTNPILLVTDVSVTCLWAACLQHSPHLCQTLQAALLWICQMQLIRLGASCQYPLSNVSTVFNGWQQA